MTTAWAPDEEVADIITSCPLISLYDTAAQRDVYAQQQQRWIYTCNQPTSPYPTYHIDDTLVSARSLSWMMSEYDITGNFYWQPTSIRNMWAAVPIFPSTTITARRNGMSAPTETDICSIPAHPTAWMNLFLPCAWKPSATERKSTNSGMPA